MPLLVRRALGAVLVLILALGLAGRAAAAGNDPALPHGADARAALLAANPAISGSTAVESTPSPGLAALKSLILPGWGQMATGHTTQAGIFFGLEAATWASYITFHRQGSMREDSYIETARRFAGIDLSGKDEEMRRLVGQYQSNDVYNQYVVLREATYFYPDSTDRAQFIASRTLSGDNAWSWSLYEDFDRYRVQRRSSEQAYQNGEYALGFAIVNRLVSAVMAARQASQLRKAAKEQAARAASQDPLAAVEAAMEAARRAPQPGRPDGRLEASLTPGPLGGPGGRVAWVVRF